MKNFSTGRLSRLFNVVIPGVAACNARGAQSLKNTTRFPNPAGRHSFGNDVARGYLRGFTLIELLVVVLIIGILSAIALPQYQRAVARSRYQQLVVVGSALYQAVERYYIANGEYPTDWRDLDISVGKASAQHDTNDTGNYHVTQGKNFHCTLRDYALGVVICRSDFSDVPEIYVRPAFRACVAENNNEKTQRICVLETGDSSPSLDGKWLYYKY